MWTRSAWIGACVSLTLGCSRLAELGDFEDATSGGGGAGGTSSASSSSSGSGAGGGGASSGTGGNGGVGGGGLPNGSACNTPGQCASSFCVDDLCCNTACDQACDSCAGPPTPGTCGDVCITLSFGDNSTDDHATAVDARIREGSPTLNYGGSNTLTVDAGTSLSHGLLRFQLSVIPTSATVIDATLELFVLDTTTSPIGIHQVLESWNEGAGSGNAVAGCNWIERLSNTSWTNVGCGPPSSSATATMGSITGASTDFVYVSASLSAAIVQGWVSNPPSNHGMMLELETGDDTFGFTAREGVDGRRPFLTVRYQP